MSIVIVKNGKLIVKNVDHSKKHNAVTKLQSAKVTIKGLPIKEYRHRHYMKTVALGWRHY